MLRNLVSITRQTLTALNTILRAEHNSKGGSIMKAATLSIIALSIVLSVSVLDAQVDTVSVNYFGTDGWDFAEEVLQTSDGGFITCGAAGADWEHNTNLYLIKTDAAGDSIWTRLIEGPESTTNGRSIQETEDGGFILTGHKDRDIYLARTDSEGNVEWTRTFGDPAPADQGEAVRQTVDGGFIVTGYTGSIATGDDTDLDAFLLKTDAMGNFEWIETYGGQYLEQGMSVELTDDGGYLMSGYTQSSGSGAKDVYLVRTDSDGIAIWEKTIGGRLDDQAEAAQQTADGGFIVTGQTKSFGNGDFDLYLIKVDASGNTVWTNTFGGAQSDGGYSVLVSNDNSEEVYTVTGRTMSFGSGLEDVYLIRADAYGNLVWEWTAGDDQLDEIGRCVIMADDGDLVIAGNTGWYSDGGVWDIFLMKVEIETDIKVSIRPSNGTTLYQGDILEFTSLINNNTEHVVEGDYWISVVLPSGNNMLVPDALLSFPGLTSGQIFPSSSMQLDNALWDADSGAQIGTYRLVGRMGLYPDVIIAEDSFEFNVAE